MLVEERKSVLPKFNSRNKTPAFYCWHEQIYFPDYTIFMQYVFLDIAI